MRRREFITLLSNATAWPLTARAQQAAMPLVGFVGSESPERWATYVRAFQQGLREVGYVDGRNVEIEYRWAEGQNERMSGLVTCGASNRSLQDVASPPPMASALI